MDCGLDIRKCMRNMERFRTELGGIGDHVMRSLPRLSDLSAGTESWDQYPEAHAHAMTFLQEKLDELAKRGIKLVPVQQFMMIFASRFFLRRCRQVSQQVAKDGIRPAGQNIDGFPPWQGLLFSYPLRRVTKRERYPCVKKRIVCTSFLMVSYLPER